MQDECFTSLSLMDDEDEEIIYYGYSSLSLLES